VQTPTAFLTAIGRKAQEKVPETDWDKFWAMGAVEFRTAELPVRDRRCVCAVGRPLQRIDVWSAISCGL
jgi:hypothetical protein